MLDACLSTDPQDTIGQIGRGDCPMAWRMIKIEQLFDLDVRSCILAFDTQSG